MRMCCRSEMEMGEIENRAMSASPGIRGQALWMAGLIVVLCVSIRTSQVNAQSTHWEHYMAEGAKAYQNGQETDAEMFYLAAREDVENAGPEDPRLAATLNALAVLYHTQRKYAQAEPLYQRVLQLLE